jgi:hypothetical protein
MLSTEPCGCVVIACYTTEPFLFEHCCQTGASQAGNKDLHALLAVLQKHAKQVELDAMALSIHDSGQLMFGDEDNKFSDQAIEEAVQSKPYLSDSFRQKVRAGSVRDDALSVPSRGFCRVCAERCCLLLLLVPAALGARARADHGRS